MLRYCVAHKKHKCWYCKKAIEIDTVYIQSDYQWVSRSGLSVGDFFSYHIICFRIKNKYLPYNYSRKTIVYESIKRVNDFVDKHPEIFNKTK